MRTMATPQQRDADIEAELLAGRMRFEQLAASDEESFLPYNEVAWRRSIDLVKRLATRLTALHVLPAELPDMLPADRGSVDIEWETSGRELLVNVPSDPGRAPSLYGERRGNLAIKGMLATDEDEDLLVHWLTGRASLA
ncbi:MAG: hypothetical protein H0V86_06760 [Chloroflexia bacterium]|nr:hypothetical protein [Chloroflexia bacterium]